MTRPPFAERQRKYEAARKTLTLWRASHHRPCEMIQCIVCSFWKARASIIWGNGGEKGNDPTCSQTCRELFRQDPEKYRIAHDLNHARLVRRLEM